MQARQKLQSRLFAYCSVAESLMATGLTASMADRQILTVPYEIAWHDDTPLVAMAEIDSRKIYPTFWKLALERHAKRTAIIKLDDVDLDSNDERFIGSIHHITRCGSTTLLQQFGALKRVYGLSEPFIFLELLSRTTADPEKAAKRVRQLACLFGSGLAPVADHIVVKWPTLLCRHAMLLNKALAKVPSVLILRDAVEVLASIEARPLENMEMSPPELLCGPGETFAGTVKPTGLTLAATKLAANCRWIARSTPTRWVDYTQLPDAGWRYIAPAFGILPTASQIEKMQTASGINAKRPDHVFISDSRDKRRDASPLAQSLANDILQPAIDEARAALKSF